MNKKNRMAQVLRQADFKDDYENCRVFQTHDNGGRPFQVVIDYDFIDIEVQYDYDTGIYEPFKTLTWDEIQEIKVGNQGDNGFWIGNSILIKLRLSPENIPDKRSNTMYLDKSIPIKHWYLYIGSEIYQFFTDTPITQYHSYGGNNDVPYPIAVSKDKIYFMLNDCYANIEDIQKIEPGFDDWFDAYPFYYRHDDKLQIHMMNGFKKWHKRIGFRDDGNLVGDIDITKDIEAVKRHNENVLKNQKKRQTQPKKSSKSKKRKRNQ